MKKFRRFELDFDYMVPVFKDKSTYLNARGAAGGNAVYTENLDDFASKIFLALDIRPKFPHEGVYISIDQDGDVDYFGLVEVKQKRKKARTKTNTN